MKYIKRFEKVVNKNNDYYFHDDFIDAINRDDIEFVKKVIELGGNDLNYQNKNGDTALMVAAFENRIEITKLLIDAGVDLDIENNSNGTNGTALLLASYNTHIEITKMLIEAGADWNVKNIHGRDFLSYYNAVLNEFEVKRKILDLYPEQYKEYLIKKDAGKYNL